MMTVTGTLSRPARLPVGRTALASTTTAQRAGRPPRRADRRMATKRRPCPRLPRRERGAQPGPAITVLAGTSPAKTGRASEIAKRPHKEDAQLRNGARGHAQLPPGPPPRWRGSPVTLVQES